MARPERASSVFHRSMVESAKLSREIRDILGKQIAEAKQALDDPIVDNNSRTVIIAHLLEMLSAVSKTEVEIGKILLGKNTKTEEIPAKSPEDIMNEIQKGKKG